mmetsp:Transcript_38753/g.82327  ORF Transcript_38753/g.82327 Transcript_38753/m.82327 type:complete len:342 (+) Transcript_38753:390-1415(+)|eukprot:CAMPEP_0206458332 /NCGR_PEP_ID=MMETSP0324_2-20121206/23503_1 /ASSEMBLY_ACC=CAM_ASM_000836 /TAXON_ID=2866 /ORGANISM="Crypthecodinium cohnii, Strain Seligo" /LENGTH=341 /DNA_ID=CAMNT_0053929643 /DNA_START=67 /DNA_END=1092 /DNA_ORIENTATION=-
MADPTPEEKLEKLRKALAVASPLGVDSQPKWEGNCEGAFNEFRLRCVHLRRSRDVLDQVEDKNGAWRFLCRFSRSRPFMSDRCCEVVKILMDSDDWMKAYADDPSLQLANLPRDIQEKLDQRAKEVNPAYEAKDPPPPLPPPSSSKGGSSPVAAPMRPANCAVVVHRCSSARILVDEKTQTWEFIGPGLVVFVSFAKGAKESSLPSAARFLLNAKLSTKAVPPNVGHSSRSNPFRTPGRQAESVVELCRQGEEQGILVLPQETLCSDLDKDNVSLNYSHACPEQEAEALVAAFVRELKVAAASGMSPSRRAMEPKVISGGYASLDRMEMTAAGSFIHAFNF